MKTKRLFISTLIAAAAMGLTAYANEAATQTTPVIAETDAPEGADKLLPLADAPAAEEADAPAEETQDADALELLLADDALVELDEAAAPDELSTETMMREWIARYAAAARFAGIRSVKGTGGGLSSGGAAATAGADFAISVAAPTPSVSVPAAGTVSLADTLTRASAAGVSLGSASASDAGTVSVATASSAAGTSTILPAAFFSTRSVFSAVPAATASYSLAGSSGVSAYTADDGTSAEDSGTTTNWAGGIGSDGHPQTDGFATASSATGQGQQTVNTDTIFTITSASGNLGVANNNAAQGFNTNGHDVKLWTNNATANITINGNFLGDGDVWFARGRWTPDAAGRFAALGEIYVIGGQIWMTVADTFSNNFILGSGTFTEGHEALDRSSFRFNANITFNGTTTILAEGTKLAFEGNRTATFANLTGSGDISVGVYSGSSVLAVTGATNYTGKINLVSGISLNWSADSTFGGLTGNAGSVAGGSYLNIANAKDGSTFAGTVGSSTSGVALALSGNGSQSFTGTNYFSSVSVSDTAALSLGGTVSLANTVVVSGSGSVSVNDSVIFILNDNYKSDNTWTLISGASSVDGWSSLTPDNFRKADGSFFIGRSEINVGTSGAVTITEVTPASLVWNGTSGNSTWNTTNKNWKNDDLSSEDKADSFYTLDNVTFGAAAAVKTVTLVNGTIYNVGTMEVSGGDYILAPGAGNSATIEGSTLTVASGASLQLSGQLSGTNTAAVNLDFEDISLVGTLKVYTNSTDSWAKLTFAGDGARTLHLYDIGGNADTTGLTISTMQMDAAGSLTANWGGRVAISALKGAGDLTIRKPQLEAITYDIGSLASYTGTLSLEGSGHELTVRLTGNNTGFTGNVKVSAGILGVNNPNALGSGTLTLNGGTLREDSAALSFSNTINVTAASTINTQGYTLTLGGAVSGTGTLRKTGAGTLVLSGDTLSLSDLVVSAGTVQVKNSEATATIGRDKTLTKVTLANGTTLQQFSVEQPTAATTIGELALSGATATLAMTNFQGYWNVDKLNIGQTSATLNLASSQSSSNTGIFEFGASSAGDVGNFAGTFNVTSTDSGASRSVSVVLSNGDIAENAVVNLASATSTTANLSLGVNADRVTIAGLVSTLGDKAGVYSGRVGTAAGGGSIPTSDTITRTLVINTAEGGDYTFNGKILANLNLEKTGAGAQTLSGTSILGDVSVSGGTLTLGGTATINHSKDSAAFTVSGGSLIFSEGLALTINLTGSGMLGDSVSLFDVSGSGVVSAANLSLSKVNFLYNGYALSTRITDVAFDNSTGVVTFTGSALSLTWNGGETGGTWDTAAEGTTVTNTPWLDAKGGAEAFYSGDFVTFNGNATVTIAPAGVSAGKVTVDSGVVTLSSGSITSAGGFYVAENASLTVSAALVGSAAVVEKTGAGTLVLSGNNTFTGKLLISGGLVELGNANALGSETSGRISVEIATGGTLDLKGKTLDKYYGNYVLSGGTLKNTGAEIGNGKRQLAGGITLTANSTIGGTHNFGMISNGYEANTLTLNGYTLTKTGGNEFWLATTTISAGTIDVQGGSITLVRTSTGDAATFRIGNAGTLKLGNTAFSVASITTEGYGAINLGGANGTLTLLGDSKIARITSAGTVVVSAGKTLTLETDRFSTAAFTVNADAKVLLANGDGTASIANVFSGAGSMEKTGSGTTTLLGTNSYMGGTTLSAGTLVAGSADALGSGTLTAAGSDGVDEVTLRVGETGATSALTLANDIFVSAGKTLILESSNEGNALAGAISGSGALKLSSGTLTLSGADTAHGNTISGGVVIDGATLRVNSAGWGNKGNLGTLFSYTGTVLKNGGVLEVTAAQTAADQGGYGTGGALRGFSVSAGTGTYRYTAAADSSVANNDANQFIGLADDATLIFDVVQAGATLTVTKVIAKNEGDAATTKTSGSLTKTGAGTLVLTPNGGANNFTGGVTIEAGTLVAGSADALGSGPVTAAGSTGVDEVTLKVGASADAALTIENDISVSAGKRLLLESSHPENELSGRISGDGALKLSSGTLSISGSVAGESSVTAAAGTTLKLTSTTAGSFAGDLTIESGAAVSISGKETLKYSDFAAGETMTIRVGGVLDLGDKSQRISTGAKLVLAGGTINASATLASDNYGSLDFTDGDNTIVAKSGESVINATIRLRDTQYGDWGGTGDLTFQVNDGARLNVAGVINPSVGTELHAGRNIIKTGAGELTLSGANTNFKGDVTLEAGTLIAANSFALGSGTLTAAGSDDVGEVTLRVTQDGSGNALTIANDISVSEGKTLILESANADNKLSGTISGNGTLKLTSGTLKLTGDNSAFTGNVKLSAGTLEIGHDNALGKGTVTVGADGKLGIAAGVTITEVSGGIKLENGAKIVVDLSTRLNETETFEVTLATNTAISLAAEAALAYSEGSATNLTDYLELKGWDNKSGWTSSLTYTNGTLTLTMAIPEPSLFGLLAGVTALGFSMSSRRRRKKA